jgi:serine/threonine protein phosphatase PrpC
VPPPAGNYAPPQSGQAKPVPVPPPAGNVVPPQSGQIDANAHPPSVIIPATEHPPSIITSVEPIESEPRFGFRGVGKTDVGVQRDVNEDALAYDDRLGIWVVCDGMGGHASGQLASHLAIQTIMDAIKTGDPPPAEGVEPLVAAMQAANGAVFQRAQVDTACRGMGTTAVGLRADDDLLHLCHCGDSRAYLLRNGQLTQMTRDHSLINLYEDRPDLAGQLGPATSNVIIRAIGLDANVEIDHRTIAMEHGDVYLLCCDGLSDLVEDWMVREIMTSGESLDAITENLIRAANANGGSDNITVIVIQILNEGQLFAESTATTTATGR